VQIQPHFAKRQAVPGESKNIVFVSQLQETGEKILDECHKPFIEPTFGFSFGLPSAASAGSLSIERVGSYDVSIVPSVADLVRIDTSHFKLADAQTHLDELAQEYPTGYSFLVFQLRAGETYKPFAYTHTALADGQVFLPCLHAHSGPIPEQEKDWDHEVYVCGIGPNAHAAIRRNKTGHEWVGARVKTAWSIPDKVVKYLQQALPETISLSNTPLHQVVLKAYFSSPLLNGDVVFVAKRRPLAVAKPLAAREPQPTAQMSPFALAQEQSTDLDSLFRTTHESRIDVLLRQRETQTPWSFPSTHGVVLPTPTPAPPSSPRDKRSFMGLAQPDRETDDSQKKWQGAIRLIGQLSSTMKQMEVHLAQQAEQIREWTEKHKQMQRELFQARQQAKTFFESMGLF
jgi:hypothetical protein